MIQSWVLPTAIVALSLAMLYSTPQLTRSITKPVVRAFQGLQLYRPRPGAVTDHTSPAFAHQQASNHLHSGAASTTRLMASTALAVAGVGTWQSPISSELITASTVKLGQPSLSPNGTLYWIEGRPGEAGRQSVVRQVPGSASVAEDVTPPPASGMYVRTTVHEYGGGDYCLVNDSFVVYSNFKDQRLYKQSLTHLSQPPVALTPEGQGLRFADAVYDGAGGQAARQRVIAVCEQHTEGKPVENYVAAVDLESGEVTPLARGHDFYHSPRLSPDGKRLAWIAWNFPNMPWDGSELYVADIAVDGSLAQPVKVAGGPDESVQQPRFDPSGCGDLYYISDSTGYWNLYRWVPGDVKAPYAVLPLDADFGVPLWVFGISTYAVLKSGHVLTLYSDSQHAGTSLGLITPSASGTSGTIQRLDTGFTSWSRIIVDEAADGSLKIVSVAASPTKATSVVTLGASSIADLVANHGPGLWKVVKASSTLQLDPGYISSPSVVEFPTTGGNTAFMNYYPPQNKDHIYPEGTLPPLLVQIHGGPTASAPVSLNLGIQYWTSRGWAIADVNYGGSTGYGRAYRNRLRASWGVVDVDDCANAAHYLADQGKADPTKLCIAGGSAGGYTTLACLAFKSVFAAGCSLYGVADMETLAQDTHKFESRYLDLLVGPYPAMKDTYVARSPIHFISQFKAPIIFFQGDEDKVVPPAQATEMHSAIKAAGLPTALVMFEGEQHGFRKPDSIRTSLDGELYFYGKVLGFPASMPAGLRSIDIDNLAASTA